MNKFLKTTLFLGGVLLTAKGFDNRLETTHYTVKSKKIPKEFDNFKIVQISDLHSDNIPSLVLEIRNEAPDIIVSTGDLVHHTGTYDYASALLKKLMDIAPVYAVTGNHDVWRGDYMEMENELSSLGVKTLHSELVNIERDGAEIALYGIDDPFYVTTKGINEFLESETKKLQQSDAFKILLFHRANWLDYFAEFGFDLIISGHIHGGQVRVPFLGGVASPRSSWSNPGGMLFPKYAGGLYEKNGTKMIVSRGLGNPMPIPRLFNRPELVTITLKSKE